MIKDENFISEKCIDTNNSSLFSSRLQLLLEQLLQYMCQQYRKIEKRIEEGIENLGLKEDLRIWLTPSVPLPKVFYTKGQLISECLSGVIDFPKNQRKIWQISALESKKWSNKQSKSTFLK